MTDTTKRGLGSDNMDPQTKQDIQSQEGQKGGQADQKIGNVHRPAEDNQKQGDQTASSNQDMSKLGQKGGSAAHPNGRGSQNADETTREEVAKMGGQSSQGGGRKSE